MNLGNRQRLLALIAAAVVGVWLTDKLILPRVIQGWAERSATLAELRESLAQGEQLLLREQSLRDRWDQMRSNTLPKDASLAENELLRSFGRWARESNVSVTSIRPQWSQTEDEYMTLECRADASGDLRGLTGFLHGVETDPLALQIKSIEIAAQDKEGQRLSFSLHVSGLLLIPKNR